jgi:hypothetical protein
VDEIERNLDQLAKKRTANAKNVEAVESVLLYRLEERLRQSFIQMARSSESSPLKHPTSRLAQSPNQTHRLDNDCPDVKQATWRQRCSTMASV